MKICEVCRETKLGDDETLIGCFNCGRLFAPCCSSEQDDTCVECVS